MFYEIGNLNKTGKFGMGRSIVSIARMKLQFCEKPKFNKYFQPISINIINDSISNKISTLSINLNVL